jgi:hypothetical protein
VRVLHWSISNDTAALLTICPVSITSAQAENAHFPRSSAATFDRMLIPSKASSSKVSRRLHFDMARHQLRNWRLVTRLLGLPRRALQALADSEGDVDAYIALVPVEDLDRPYIGAAVGRRLLAAGRAKEAFAALERAKPKRQADQSRQYDELYELGYLRGHDDVWEEVYIDALDAPATESAPSSSAGRPSSSVSPPRACVPT